MTLCLFVMLTLLGMGNAHALYKSVDASGKVVYSDKPPAPGATEKPLQLRSLPVSVVSAPEVKPSPADPQASAPPPGEVILYMATWCGYCKAAKAYLANKGIAYREFDIDTPSGKAAFAQLGGKGVPVLLARGQRVRGFTAQSYDAVFLAGK